MKNEDDTIGISRRELLAASAGIASAMLLPTSEVMAKADANDFHIIDTNVSLFQWPFRRLSLDDTESLEKKLRSLGVTEAWAGSFEGIFHRNLAEANARLAKECRDHPLFVPIGSINPSLPGWEDDLRRCFEEHKMIGIRLHPNYHGYSLSSPAFARLVNLVSEAGRFIQLVVAMEDTRTQNEQLRVEDVDLSQLVTILKSNSLARIQLLNHRPRASFLTQIAELPGIYFDTARVEGTDGVPSLVESVKPDRVLFGSHSPFLIPEAALIRTHESGQLDHAALNAVLSRNAERLRQGSVS